MKLTCQLMSEKTWALLENYKLITMIIIHDGNIAEGHEVLHQLLMCSDAETIYLRSIHTQHHLNTASSASCRSLYTTSPLSVPFILAVCIWRPRPAISTQLNSTIIINIIYTISPANFTSLVGKYVSRHKQTMLTIPRLISGLSLLLGDDLTLSMWFSYFEILQIAAFSAVFAVITICNTAVRMFLLHLR